MREFFRLHRKALCAFVVVCCAYLSTLYIGIRKREIDVAELPVVRYLHSLGANYDGRIGIVDFAFNEHDAYFKRLLVPEVHKEFLVHERERSLDLPEEYQCKDNSGLDIHGALMARVIHRIAPSARFVCARISMDPAQIINPEFCANRMNELGVRVINISLEFHEPGKQWILRFAEAALEHGMMIVFSSTNSRLPLEVGVYAQEIIALNKRLPGFAIWIGADTRPGVRSRSSAYPVKTESFEYFFTAATRVDTGIMPATGSSPSAAVVSGIVACLLDLYPEATPKEILELLRKLSVSTAVPAASLWNYSALE